MINPHDPPPRRWIDESLGDPIHMISIGHALKIGRTENPDDVLALSILADAPSFRYGRNAANGRTHALWALMQLRRDDELPVYLEPLQHALEVWLKHRITPPVPAELLLMASCAWLRLDRARETKVAVVLCGHLRLSVPQREDLGLLVASIPANARPSTTPAN